MPFLRFFGISSPLFGVLGVNKKLSFYAYAEEQVEKRLAEPTASPKSEKMDDMLSYFMSAGEKNPDLMTRNEITTNCFVNMGAGALSQSKVLEEVLRYVVPRPEAQDAIYEEITSRNLSLPISNKDAQLMPYLNGVIREGLRLHHSGFGMISGRNTPSEGLTLPNGVHLPAGIEVGMEPRVLGSREDTYQEKPLEFRPERWLPYPGEDEKVYQARRAAMEHTDLSFGYGASACAGRNVAMMSVHKFMANLIATYKVQFLPEYISVLNCVIP
jgi:cytochrome P450